MFIGCMLGPMFLDFCLARQIRSAILMPTGTNGALLISFEKSLFAHIVEGIGASTFADEILGRKTYESKKKREKKRKTAQIPLLTE